MRTAWTAWTAVMVLVVGCGGRPVADDATIHDSARPDLRPTFWDGMPRADVGSGAKKVSIFKINDGTEPEGTKVELSDVIVTAVDGYGQYTGDVYVQDLKGGPGSAIKLYRPKRIDGGDVSDLKPGDRIKAVGTIKYFSPAGGFNDKKHPNKKHIKEVAQPLITRLGPGLPPLPITVTAADLNTDPVAASYEFMLVQVVNVAVTSPVNPYGEIEVTGNLMIGDELFPPTHKVGECISITGISLYFYGYTLNPRQHGDLPPGSGCH